MMIIMTVVLSYSVNISVCVCMSKDHNANGNKSKHFIVSSLYLMYFVFVIYIHVCSMYKLTFYID